MHLHAPAEREGHQDAHDRPQRARSRCASPPAGSDEGQARSSRSRRPSLSPVSSRIPSASRPGPACRPSRARVRLRRAATSSRSMARSKSLRIVDALGLEVEPADLGERVVRRRVIACVRGVGLVRRSDAGTRRPEACSGRRRAQPGAAWRRSRPSASSPSAAGECASGSMISFTPRSRASRA